MLKIQDNYNLADFFDFKLIHVEKNRQWSYVLNSATQPGFNLQFDLPYSFDFQSGYSVSPYFFKNRHFAQKDVIEVRVDGYLRDNGRIGYLVQLNSIFDPKILSINKYLFSYFYYTLGNIFFNDDYKQLKIPDFSKTTFEITDFFDEDVLVLMVCDQLSAEIAGFKIENYIADMYRHGFYLVSSSRKNLYTNSSHFVKDNFDSIRSNANKLGHYSLKLRSLSNEIVGEDFFSETFKKLLLKDVDPETRFLTLYQTVEILITKILTNELLRNVCSATIRLEGFALKRLLDEEVKEMTRITHLFNSYSYSDQGLKNELTQEIYALLQYCGFPDYTTSFDPNKTTMHDLFYDYRNKLLHSHRHFKLSGLNEQLVLKRMKDINDLTELLIIDVILTFNKRP